MELGLTRDNLLTKLSSDPIKAHLVKRVALFIVSCAVIVLAWAYLADRLFLALHQPVPVAGPADVEILAQTHAAVDQTLQLALTSGQAGTVSTSFGEEVQVQTIAADNPFQPLVQPKVEQPIVKTAPPEAAAEDRLALRGLAKIGSKYMAIIADANGNSQVISEGATFNGWQVKVLKADKVQLTKGKRSMTLVWERMWL